MCRCLLIYLAVLLKCCGWSRDWKQRHGRKAGFGEGEEVWVRNRDEGRLVSKERSMSSCESLLWVTMSQACPSSRHRSSEVGQGKLLLGAINDEKRPLKAGQARRAKQSLQDGCSDAISVLPL